jgi:hypothetical protein
MHPQTVVLQIDGEVEVIWRIGGGIPLRPVQLGEAIAQRQVQFKPFLKPHAQIQSVGSRSEFSSLRTRFGDTASTEGGHFEFKLILVFQRPPPSYCWKSAFTIIDNLCLFTT